MPKRFNNQKGSAGIFIVLGVVVFLGALFILHDMFLTRATIANASSESSPVIPSGQGISTNTTSPNSTVENKNGTTPQMTTIENQNYAGKAEYSQNILDFSKLKPYPPIDSGNPTAIPKETDKFITANFIDFSQIQYIHKFRACHGHDYYGPDYDGESEPLSAMKLYLKPIDSLQYTNNKVKVFAPFDGVVVQVDPTDTQRGRHYVLMREPFNGWYMTFFHQTFKDQDLHYGTKVKAGQFLSYATTSNIGNDFDIALQRFNTENGQYNGQWTTYNYQISILKNLEPIFPHMTDQVASEWAAHGITVANTITSKKYREANPCTCYGQTPGTADCNFQITDPEKVWIKS